MTARSMPVADEFVFVLSESGSDEAAGSAALSRTFGFCRRSIGRGVAGRADVGVRYPECLCLLTTNPLFAFFPSVLKAVHGLRLLHPEVRPV